MQSPSNAGIVPSPKRAGQAFRPAFGKPGVMNEMGHQPREDKGKVENQKITNRPMLAGVLSSTRTFANSLSQTAILIRINL